MVATVERVTGTEGTEAISLRALMTRKSLDTLRGILGQDLISDRKTRDDRSPSKAFYTMAGDTYGLQQWANQHGIPLEEPASVFVDRAAFELGFTEAYKEKRLEGMEPEKCVPSIFLATNTGDTLLWLKVKEFALDIYEHHCPSTTKTMVEREEARRERLAPPSHSNQTDTRFNPAPDTKETRELAEFRDSLSVSLLREWRLYCGGIVSPYDANRLHQIDDFIEKFQRSGYRLDAPSLNGVGGLTVEMLARLKDVRQAMQSDLLKGRTLLRDAIGDLLGQKVDSPPGLGLELSGSREAFQVTTETSAGELLGAIATPDELVTAESNQELAPYSMVRLPEFALAGLVAQAAYLRTVG